MLTQHYDLARPIGLKLLAETPHDPEVLYLNGVPEFVAGNYDDARAHLEEAVSLVPDFFHSRYYLGVVLVHFREWKEAREHLEKAIALGDTEPAVHYELGMALHGLGENDKSKDEAKQYQDMKQAEEDELEANAEASQGDEDLAGGKVQEAIGHYREACNRVAGKASFKYKLAIALQKSGDNDGERKLRAAAMLPEPLSISRWRFMRLQHGQRLGSILLSNWRFRSVSPKPAKPWQWPCGWNLEMRRRGN